MGTQPDSNKQPLATEKLMDEEVRQDAEHRAKISKATLEVEAIFLREDLTMGDLAQVLDMFNSRAQFVFSKATIKSVKESYERNN